MPRSPRIDRIEKLGRELVEGVREGDVEELETPCPAPARRDRRAGISSMGIVVLPRNSAKRTTTACDE
jgi:hypothetical protein